MCPVTEKCASCVTSARRLPKVFKEWRKGVARQIRMARRHKNDPSNYNERQKTRYDVLNWSERRTPATGAAHLSSIRGRP